ITDDTIKQFKATPDVNDVSPLADFSSVVTFNGLSANADLQGIQASYFKYAGIAMAAGKTFTDDSGDANDIILSSAALQLFGVTDPTQIIGKPVSFRVIAAAAGDTSGATDQVPLTGNFTVTGVTSDAAAIYAMIPLATLSQQIGITSY